MHLLAGAFEALSNEECLRGAWKDYDWSPAIAMAAVFFIFFAEFFASRAGAAYLDKRGMQYDNHGHDLEGSANVHASHGTEISATNNGKDRKSSESDRISTHTDNHSTYGNSAIGMITGVTILEFGVLFHSAILGLTLATTGSDEFRVLLIVIVFHQMFEGLGLGARLAELPLKKAHNWIPYVAATAYFILTPIFIAIGLGVRKTYNDESTAALIVSGILDSLSGGVLLYTGIVELLAHDFIYSGHMKRASLPYVLYASFCVLLGAGLMSRWRYLYKTTVTDDLNIRFTRLLGLNTQYWNFSFLYFPLFNNNFSFLDFKELTID